ncbi:hypothetical protein B0J13DRAFT_621130 [Dactylonectria estremocensis]|uniref:CFEM domain-containing protein n=1 Tax=Dactylonectria estremocensis TaxID=1079267 RepID=A0A9P9F0C2_9HYPO|nr:hypothetical protein B0J13DRAFT_621130 [Dactylonectria estremocensis]
MFLHRLLLFTTATLIVTTTATSTFAAAATATTSTNATATQLAALAQFQANLPECAGKCLAIGVKEQGCAATDVDCQCSNLEAIIKTTSPCLVKAGCDLDEISDTATLVAQLCAEQISALLASQSAAAAAAAATETTGAATLLPQNIVWAGAAAVIVVVVAAL